MKKLGAVYVQVIFIKIQFKIYAQFRAPSALSPRKTDCCKLDVVQSRGTKEMNCVRAECGP